MMQYFKSRNGTTLRRLCFLSVIPAQAGIQPFLPFPKPDLSPECNSVTELEPSRECYTISVIPAQAGIQPFLPFPKPDLSLECNSVTELEPSRECYTHAEIHDASRGYNPACDMSDMLRYTESHAGWR